MLPFHVLSLPLLQTLFLHNILLIFALLIDVDGIARRALSWISRARFRRGVGGAPA